MNNKSILKNKIKSITETVTQYKNGKEITYKQCYILYDTEGKELEEISYNKDGTILEKLTFKYDKDNNKIEENIYRLKEAVEEQHMEIKNKRITFKFNNFKDKTEEVEYDSDNNVVRKIIYEFNNNRKKSSETYYDSQGKIKKKFSYTYNNKNLKTKRECYKADNTLESVKNYLYEFY